MSLQVSHLKDLIGSRVITSRADLLSGRYATELRSLIEERGVLVFPGTFFTDEEQVTFARTISDIIPQGPTGMAKISLDPEVNETADYLRASFLWHFDGFSDAVPQRGCLLNARRLSDQGGDTQFCNTCAAYEALPVEIRTRIENLRVIHDNVYIQCKVNPGASDEQIARWGRQTPKAHPIIWTHRSGRRSLAIGETASAIEGLDLAEGRRLLQELQDFATQPRFVYSHAWQVGDLVMWDNYGTLHRVTPYPFDSGRLMHRVALAGGEKIA